MENTAFEQPPFLAYLSACSTGQVQDERMLDEGLHLVTAFQLAGFQHVIGTLWDVDDELCGEVARIVYDVALKEITHQSVSSALHVAIKYCRDWWRNDVLEYTEGLMGVAPLPAGSGRDYGSLSVRKVKELELVPYVHFGG